MPSLPSPIYLVAFAVVAWLAWLLRRNERAYRARTTGRRDGSRYLNRLRHRRPPVAAPAPSAEDGDAPRRVPAGPIAVPVPREKPTGTFAAGAEGEARVGAVLRAAGIPVLEDFYIESENGYSQIDHLAHLGSRLVVIETKNLTGTLRGAGRSERWAQSRPQADDRTFYSPLLQVEKQRKWLHALLTPTTTVEIEVLVVLAGKAAPPPGAAGEVVSLGDLAARLRALGDRPGNRDGADIAWAQIRHAVSVTPQIQARLAHAMDHERRASWSRAPNSPPAPAASPGLPGQGLRAIGSR